MTRTCIGRQWIVLLAALTGAGIGACRTPAPTARTHTTLRHRSTRPEAAFAAAEQALRERFRIELRDPKRGLLRTAAIETRDRVRGGRVGDALGTPRRVRKTAEVRVEPDDYHDTLTQLVREIQQAGALPILLTAPRASELLPLMVERGHGPSLQVIYDRHQHYAQLTRDVARECNVPLLDLAAIIEAEANRDELFLDDGIHLNPTGRRRIAELIHGKLVELYDSRP